jgi:putative endonuclease
MALAQYIAGLFSRSRSNSSPSEPEPAHLRTGRLGERLAARHLRRNGYKVLYRNFRPPHGGEIDIVCREKKTLVFVEVKTRSADGLGRPADAVDAEKEEALIRGAQRDCGGDHSRKGPCANHTHTRRAGLHRRARMTRAPAFLNLHLRKALSLSKRNMNPLEIRAGSVQKV